MPEIRFTVTKKLNKLILEVSESLGVDKSDYHENLRFSGCQKSLIFVHVRSLILPDLKSRVKKNEDKE